MKNDNLNITFSIEDYQIRILKFTYECQTWNTLSHSHSSNSYEIHFIPKGKGTLISAQSPYELYPDILYTTGPHIEHQQYSDPFDQILYLDRRQLFTRIRYDYAERTVQPSRLKSQTDKPYPFQPLRAEFSSKKDGSTHGCRRHLFKRKSAFDLGNRFPAWIFLPQSFSCRF